MKAFPALICRPATSLLAAIAMSVSAQSPIRLPAYNIDPSQVSVSGHHSGANMAVQLGVAYSSRIMGVGIFGSAWAYDCGRIDLQAFGECSFNSSSTSVAHLAANMRQMSGRDIDPVEGLSRQRVYLFLGSQMDTDQFIKLELLLSEFVSPSNLQFENDVAAENVYPIDFDTPYSLRNNYSCTTPLDRYQGIVQYPFANCGFDGARASLRWIYGSLRPRNDSPDGDLVAVNQSEFASYAQGMDTLAWLYVPKQCKELKVCRLHVFLHGTGQSYFQINEPHYARYAGLDRWADTNGIVLLFPQVYPDEFLNPKGTWDTSGIYDRHFDRKGGTQLEVIMTMITRIVSGFSDAQQAIEYYHAGFDHYFVTSNAGEIAKLDGDAAAGWARTGQSFAVYSSGTTGAHDVCRFFTVAFGAASSHFYTSAASECESVKSNPLWQFEGAPFAVREADGEGSCGAQLIPLYRFYNNGKGGAPNHRYTTNPALRASMIASGWVPEGSGIGVVGCVLANGVT